MMFLFFPEFFKPYYHESQKDIRPVSFNMLLNNALAVLIKSQL